VVQNVHGNQVDTECRLIFVNAQLHTVIVRCFCSNADILLFTAQNTYGRCL